MSEKIDLPEDVYDIIVIGGGPAGFTSGIYAARTRMNILLVESMAVMGQATMTENIENYPGVEKITGFELISTLKKQAERFDVKFRTGTVTKISKCEQDGTPVLEVEDENGTNRTLAVIIASGASAKKIGIPGEKEFLGKGVSYCATCDGAFFRDKDIVVIGGGDTAVEEAIYLTRFGKKVTLVHRKDRLRAAKILQEKALANKKIEYVLKSTVDSINGSGKVEKIIVTNKNTKEKKDISCEGVFIFVGWRPNTDFLKELLNKDKSGAILSNPEMKTSEPGIFAAGDCCSKLLHQVVTACGDGAVAAVSAQHYVEGLKGTLYG